MMTWPPRLCSSIPALRSLAGSVLLLGGMFVAVGAAHADTREQVNLAAARDALAQVLEANGLAPDPASGRTLADYIVVEKRRDADGSQSVLLSVDLNADGAMVPHATWRNMHKEYCKMRARETPTPPRVLRFEVVKHAETAAMDRIHGMEGYEGMLTRYQYEVFARVIRHGERAGHIERAADARTSVAQQHGQSARTENPDRAALPEPLGEALDPLRTGLGTPTDPCGDVLLRHISGDQAGKPALFLAGYHGYYGKNLTYTWDFGDGTQLPPTKGNKQPSHVYARGGTYQVSVRVEDEQGQARPRSIGVTIKDKPAEDPRCTFTATVTGAVSGTFKGKATVTMDTDDNGYNATIGSVRLESGQFHIDIPFTQALPAGQSGSRQGASLGTAGMEDATLGDGRSFAIGEGGSATIHITRSRVVPIADMPEAVWKPFLRGQQPSDADRAKMMRQVGDVVVHGTLRGSMTEIGAQLMSALPGFQPGRIQFQAQFEARSEALGCNYSGMQSLIDEKLRESGITHEQMNDAMRMMMQQMRKNGMSKEDAEKALRMMQQFQNQGGGN